MSLVKKVSFIIIAKYFLVWLVGFTFKVMDVSWLSSRAVASLALRFVPRWQRRCSALHFLVLRLLKQRNISTFLRIG